MFVEKIRICNLFAYYGEIEVNFTLEDKKPIYAICGDNGFGKTSFIRSAKLLFLGTGLLEDEKIPETILNFCPKISTSMKFCTGVKDYWEGIFNLNAIKENKEDFSVSFSGKFENQNFILKRFWNLKDNKIIESLYFQLGEEEFKDEIAQYKINTILPPEFVQFFFFDSEELEQISENLRGSLSKKIEEILQVKPLKMIASQALKYKEELRTKQISNEKEKNSLLSKKSELENLNRERETNNKEIKLIEDEQEIIDIKISKANRKIGELYVGIQKELDDLKNEKDVLDSKKAELKEKLTQSLKNVIFASHQGLVENLKNELDILKNSGAKEDIEAFKKLMPNLKDFANEKMDDLKLTQKLEFANAFMKVLDEFAQNLENTKTQTNFLNLSLANKLEQNLVRFEENSLFEDLQELKKNKNQLLRNKEEMNEFSLDESTKEKQKNLEEEILKLKSEKEDNKNRLSDLIEYRMRLKNNLEALEKGINSLEQSINTERIKEQLDILDNLEKNIDIYIQRLIYSLKDELRDKILSHYKELLPNDNISFVEISDDFEISLKDGNNETVVITSQSKGQKQTLATAIFWSLSELSNSKIPLIIDTPIARLDGANRKRTIQNYYTKGVQTIILPTDAEMGIKEYTYARPFLAGLYKIENDNDRSHARIKRVNDIDEILKEN